MKNTIGDRIRKCRANTGLSQDYVANKLNISTSAYSNIETNKTELTVSRLIKLAEIFEVSVYEIIDVDHKPNSYSTPEGSANNVYENEINALKLQMLEIKSTIEVMQKKDKKKK